MREREREGILLKTFFHNGVVHHFINMSVLLPFLHMQSSIPFSLLHGALLPALNMQFKMSTWECSLSTIPICFSPGSMDCINTVYHNEAVAQRCKNPWQQTLLAPSIFYGVLSYFEGSCGLSLQSCIFFPTAVCF